MLLGTRRYQVGRDGGFWIADAARNGKYKTTGTVGRRLVVTFFSLTCNFGVFVDLVSCDFFAYL